MNFETMSSLFYITAIFALVPFINVNSKLVTNSCYACLCEAATNCKQDVGCNGDVCGPFQITPAFWKDGGEPYSKNGVSNDKFSDCANNLECAAETIENYMNKYQKDCNNDGRIDCDDFALIHKYGPNACERSLSSENLFLETYLQCKSALNL